MPNSQNWLEGASADQPQAEGQGGAVVASAKAKAQLPANWRQLLGQGWELNHQGMPSRQAGRVVVVAQGQNAVGSRTRFSDATHHWLFTPVEA